MTDQLMFSSPSNLQSYCKSATKQREQSKSAKCMYTQHQGDKKYLTGGKNGEKSWFRYLTLQTQQCNVQLFITEAGALNVPRHISFHSEKKRKEEFQYHESLLISKPFF